MRARRTRVPHRWQLCIHCGLAVVKHTDAVELPLLPRQVGKRLLHCRCARSWRRAIRRAAHAEIVLQGLR